MTEVPIETQIAAAKYVHDHYMDICSTFPDTPVVLTKDALRAALATLEATRHAQQNPSALAIELAEKIWEDAASIADLLSDDHEVFIDVWAPIIERYMTLPEPPTHA